jgi:predicted dehydrogenase
LKKVNMGLIGLGGMGRIHFYNSLRLKNVNVIAVADKSSVARQNAKAHGIPRIYDDYKKLLETPAIDCVIIALPTFLHSECAVMAAECGKHILLEKPLARNVHEGRRITSKVQKAGVKAMVGYPLRFSEFAKIKDEIDLGHLGDVVTAHAVDVWRGPFSGADSDGHVGGTVPDWWLNPELSGGGALIDLGPHMINLLLHYFGDEIESVRSQLGYRFNMPFEDHAVCFLKFKQGPLATVNVGWYCQERTIKMEILGTMKTLSMALATPKTSSRILHMLKIRQLPESSAFHKELLHFVNCVITERDPSPSAAEALKDLETIMAAYENQIENS